MKRKQGDENNMKILWNIFERSAFVGLVPILFWKEFLIKSGIGGRGGGDTYLEEEGEFLQVAPPPKKGHVQPLPRGAGWGAREAGRGGGGPGGWAWGTNTIIYVYQFYCTRFHSKLRWSLDIWRAYRTHSGHTDHNTSTQHSLAKINSCFFYWLGLELMVLHFLSPFFLTLKRGEILYLGAASKKIVLLGGAHHKVAPPTSCGQSTTFLWKFFFA